ncbi:MAG: D-alanyl-D-alanine carboxypeptidase/D-alanyl-D-alanine-endopeptidase [Ignavibacteriales bacterium]|nr:MAG: D-alanyl-D-alanine carboxypeptidase/D-alanyl-D-alanine-endopeptidase [Ignavibacteriales bacterium]
MNRLNNFLVLIGLVFLSEAAFAQKETFTNTASTTLEELRNEFDQLFEDPDFYNAQWGVCIQSLETGEFLYRRNENKLLMPASNLKLLTTASGLQFLGSDFRFKTEIGYSGKIEGTTLKGDLIIRGYGDPTISGRYTKDDVLKYFNDWADSLINAGIEEITGNVIGDDNAFDDIGLGSGWSWDYESYWYSAPSGALSLNDNCVDIVASPAKNGDKAEIKLIPDNKYTVIVNRVITVPFDSSAGIEIYRERGTNVITVSGKIREGSKPVKLYATVNNPTQFFVVVLKEVLKAKGINVRGFAIDIDDQQSETESDFNLLFMHESLPLSEIIKVINKNSQNFFAEQLLKAIAYYKTGLGTSTRGIRQIKQITPRMGINSDNFTMVDGSGLSRLNLISAQQMVAVLRYMYQSEYFNDYYNSLPIAGRDGTLADRMRKSAAFEKIRAKTGFIGGVRSLSGYAVTADGETIAFSMIVNNFTVPLVLAENLQDMICLRLSTLRRK